ncbi:recombinase family protein [Clostridium manihotivorum]|uniref:Recombinase family protein n=1 Tax=Clostridium manihotivorum TaxID=2320868 RepID=A0A410DSN9_9CLOT|nr:recombinase family protein [Clostridium manihotivorum]QAA32089.1 recombinase family protein [Clostridium manihotivorum]
MKAAIYSRKSIFTGKGDSIENQIEFCKEYGKKLGIEEYIVYEDEGFSGKNTNRPRFQQLLKDAKKKAFDFLICYRLDRISRNVADFSSTLEILQKYNIDFISIREQFDTSTPMGRAMIYIASVFAQLERETIAERVRDNMLQLSKSGRWLGGQEPFGFKAERVTYLDEDFKERSLMQLSPYEEELTVVAMIFSKYMEYNSLSKVVKYLDLCCIRGKNGGHWSTIQLKRILSSPLYVKSSKATNDYLKNLGINVFGEANGNGYLTYNKTKNITEERNINEWIAAISRHPGIIDADSWLSVQNKITATKEKTIKRLGTGNNDALLLGLLQCAKCGALMKLKQGRFSHKLNRRLDYYVCCNKDKSHGTTCNNKNIRVDIIDKLVTKNLKILGKDFLSKELSALLDTSAVNQTNKDELQIIDSKIKENEAIISSLIKKLAICDSERASKHIVSEIEKLDTKLQQLKAEKLNSSTLTKNYKPSDDNLTNDNLSNGSRNIKILLEAFNKINNEYSAITTAEHKRALLRLVVKTVQWDGSNVLLTLNSLK